MSKRKKKKKPSKARSEAAYAMRVHRYGAGSHGDKRKENSKNACRGKVDASDA